MFLLVYKQVVTLTGRNCTGLPCNVGRLTAHAPGDRPGGSRPPTRLPAGRPPAGSVTDDDRRL